jgi:hypothetical protein
MNSKWHLVIISILAKVSLLSRISRLARAAEQATIASTEATRLGMKQTEQQIAQAEINTQRQQLAENAKKRASEVAKQFSKVDQKTGKVTVDYRNVFNTLALEGHDLDTAMNYAQKADLVDAGQLKTDMDRLNYAQNRAQGLNEILRVQSDPARAQQIHDAAFESVARLSGPEAAANAFGAVFGNARQSGDLIGQAKVTSQAQISPATAEQLKISQEQLKQDILDGKSITLCYPEYNIYSSAIVTGNIPIATGVALDIKRKGGTNHVWCFVGDMTSETGTFFENWKYAVNHDLPITFVIENNGKSVCTETHKVWNTDELYFAKETRKIIYYEYQTKYPHAGAGARIQF